MLEHCPHLLVERALRADARLLLVGEPGTGKSSLATRLARLLRDKGRDCLCISADPGSPAFGVPGALGRGQWCGEHWRPLDCAALCTLDAARFRLPLVDALRALAAPVSGAALLIDAPGVVRGVAGAELLMGMVEAAGADAVVVLVRDAEALPWRQELGALTVPVLVMRAHPAARRLTKPERARRRTLLWDRYLGDAEEHTLVLEDIRIIGTPPPLNVPTAWSGRQIAVDGAGSREADR